MKGFSLVEILIVIGIMAVVGTVAARFQVDLLNMNTIIRDNLTSQQEGRTLLQMSVRELRSASPSAAGAYSLATVGTSTLMFYSDIDGDNLIDRVRYFLSGSTLRKGVIKPTGSPLGYTGTERISDVVHNIISSTSTAIFQYYDASYNGAATSTPLVQPVNTLSVRLVKILLAIDRSTSRQPGQIVMTSQVSLRNLKDNL